MPIPDQATIDKALAALHLNVPYYTAEQIGNEVIFRTRDGKVTWRVEVLDEPSGSKEPPKLRCEGRTKKGAQCRANAIAGTDPPRCATHRTQ